MAFSAVATLYLLRNVEAQDFAAQPLKQRSWPDTYHPPTVRYDPQVRAAKRSEKTWSVLGIFVLFCLAGICHHLVLKQVATYGRPPIDFKYDIGRSCRQAIDRRVDVYMDRLALLPSEQPTLLDSRDALEEKVADLVFIRDQYSKVVRDNYNVEPFTLSMLIVSGSFLVVVLVLSCSIGLQSASTQLAAVIVCSFFVFIMIHVFLEAIYHVIWPTPCLIF